MSERARRWPVDGRRPQGGASPPRALRVPAMPRACPPCHVSPRRLWLRAVLATRWLRPTLADSASRLSHARSHAVA